MKKIKIFALPSHATKERTSGVDYFRVIQPAKFLNGFEYNGYKFETYIYDVQKDKGLDWIKVAKNYDLIFFNYTANPWGFATMGAMARHFGVPMVMDMDDDLWDVQPDNPAYNVYHKGSKTLEEFTAICNEVDYITTTNLYLKHVITHNTLKRYEKLKIFPNYVDLDNIYKYRPKFKDDGQIQLLHHGSTTHFIDLEEQEFEKGIDMIMKDFPNVTLKTVGAFLPRYKHKWGHRYFNAFGHQDYYKWSTEVINGFMDESDIMVVPLAENVYTRCKSDIKFSESSAFKKPGVYQSIRQYQETVIDGENGFLAKSAEDWYQAIKRMILDSDLRRKIGEAAYKTTVEDKQMKNNISQYAEFFLKVLDK